MSAKREFKSLDKVANSLVVILKFDERSRIILLRFGTTGGYESKLIFLNKAIICRGGNQRTVIENANGRFLFV